MCDYLLSIGTADRICSREYPFVIAGITSAEVFRNECKRIEMNFSRGEFYQYAMKFNNIENLRTLLEIYPLEYVFQALELYTRVGTQTVEMLEVLLEYNPPVTIAVICPLAKANRVDLLARLVPLVVNPEQERYHCHASHFIISRYEDTMITAIENGHSDVVELLMRYNFCTQEELLNQYILAGQIADVRRLLEAGIGVNTRSMWCAFMSCNLEICDIIAANGRFPCEDQDHLPVFYSGERFIKAIEHASGNTENICNIGQVIHYMDNGYLIVTEDIVRCAIYRHDITCMESVIRNSTEEIRRQALLRTHMVKDYKSNLLLFLSIDITPEVAQLAAGKPFLQAAVNIKMSQPYTQYFVIHGVVYVICTEEHGNVPDSMELYNEHIWCSEILRFRETHITNALNQLVRKKSARSAAAYH
jgi:hypothetical protein